MRHISIAKTSFAVGAVFAAWHTIWVILVAAGWATEVLRFVLELHFLKIDFQLAPYRAVTAFSLVAVTFCVGALIGAIFALVWNWLDAGREADWARATKHRSATVS